MDLDQLKQILESRARTRTLRVRDRTRRFEAEDPEGHAWAASTALPAAAGAAGGRLDSRAGGCRHRREPGSRCRVRPGRRAIEDIELAVVKSPIVGTFYRSPEPGAPPFVEVGSIVKKGQVLCIIEAMKLMNEIDSECDGEIVSVYLETGQPVQYGERLFAIRTR